MPRTKTTMPPQQKILIALAVNSELEQYQMPKETGLSYRTILRFLKGLEKEGIIKLAKTEASQKGGMPKKIYTLTPQGVVYALMTKNIWNEPNSLTKLIAAHSDKALLFKKWGLFQKEGLEKTATELLMDELIELKTILRASPQLPNVQTDDLKLLTDTVLVNLAFPSISSIREIFKADPELKNFITNTIQTKKAAAEKVLETIKLQEKCLLNSDA